MYKIETLLRKGKYKIRQEGFLALCRDTLWSHKMAYLWEHTFLEIPSICPKIQGIMVEKIDSAKRFDELVAHGFDISWYGMSLPQCKQRLNKGAIMFCAIRDCDIVHVTWIGVTPGTRGDFYHFAVNYEREASIGGTMTAPNLINKGVYTYVYSVVFQYLAGVKKTRAVFETGLDNGAVLCTQSKLGAQIWGIGHNLRILGFFNYRWVEPYHRSPKQ